MLPTHCALESNIPWGGGMVLYARIGTDAGALLSPAEICFTELKGYCERAKKGANLLVTRPGKPVMW